MTRDEMLARLVVVNADRLETSCGCLCICTGEPRVKPRHPIDCCDLCRLCREAEDLKDMLADLGPWSSNDSRARAGRSR